MTRCTSASWQWNQVPQECVASVSHCSGAALCRCLHLYRVTSFSLMSTHYCPSELRVLCQKKPSVVTSVVTIFNTPISLLFFTILLVVVVVFSSLARIWGECLTIHSPPAFFFFFFGGGRESSLCTKQDKLFNDILV